MASLQQILALARVYNKSDGSVYINWDKSGSDRFVLADDGELQLANATASGQGLLLGGDFEFYRSASNNLTLAGTTIASTKVIIPSAATPPSPDTLLHLWAGTAGVVTAIADTILTIENTTNAYINFLTPNTAQSGISFGDVNLNNVAYLIYDHGNNRYVINANNALQLYWSDGAFAFQKSTILSAAIGTLTINAFTLGGAISGGNNNLDNIARIALGNLATATSSYILLNSVAIDAPAEAKYGLNSQLSFTGNTSNNALTGVYSRVTMNSTTATSGVYAGIIAFAEKVNSANMTATIGLVGVLAQAHNDFAGGTVTGVAGVYVNTWGNGQATSTVTNAYGINIVSPEIAGGVTNAYGIYINNITGAGTLNYAIYANGGAIYSAGNVGVGTAPSYPLHISKTLTGAGDLERGLHINYINNGNTANNRITGIVIQNYFSGTAASSGRHVGLSANAYSNVAQNLTRTASGQEGHGLVGITGNVLFDSVASNTITSIAAVVADYWGVNTAGATVNNAHGFYVVSPYKPAGTITNAYGLYIEAITQASTINRAIYVAGGVVELSGSLFLSENASLAGEADIVKLGGYDLSAGNRTLALATETAVAADIGLASTHSLTVRINGANYKVPLVSV